ncbi:MAG: hypothetical protein ABMB14_11280, partial [Myxococcota bacterium]
MPFPDLSRTSDADLADALRRAPWASFDPAADGRALRDRLLSAPAEARRIATRAVAERAPVAVPRLQEHGISAIAADREGRLLAVGGDCGRDYSAGASLSVWDLEVGRIVASADRFPGPIGWSGHPSMIQWRPDGTLAVAWDTNGVGLVDPFASGSAILDVWYLTEGWDEPPGFAVSPQGDVFVACWGPNQETGAVVGADGAPRWLPGDEEIGPMRRVRWTDRGLFGNTRGSRVIVEPTTGRSTAREGCGAWSGSGRRVLAGAQVRDADTDAVLFELPSGAPRELPFDGGPDAVFLDEDAVVAAYERWVEVVDARGAVRIRVAPRQADGRVPDLRPVVAAPDGGRIAILGQDGRIRLFERG